MKNLIIALALFFAVGATAQTKKTTSTKVVTTTKLSPEMAAKKNVADLVAFTPLSAEQQSTLEGLFTSKYMNLQSGELSDERKNIVYESVSRKLETVLDPAVFAKVKANTKLYNSLIK